MLIHRLLEKSCIWTRRDQDPSCVFGAESGGSPLIAMVRTALSYQSLDSNVMRRLGLTFVPLEIPVVRETDDPLPTTFFGISHSMSPPMLFISNRRSLVTLVWKQVD
jgi:hypothetical protein